MKNTDKKWQVQRKQNSFASVILIIAIVAIIGLGFSACGDDTGGNGSGGNGSNTGGNSHTHTYSTTWSSSATQHWKECNGADCDAKTGTANHAPSNSVCTTCGYDSHIHSYSTTWSSNATQHWKECTGAGCDAKTQTANHAPADGICTTCGYDNTGGTHTHTYSTTWSSNATQHWKECTGAGCDAKTETANHAPSNGVCSTCGYDNTPAHIHSYSTTWSYNATQHWKECTGAGCDAKTETANHAPADGVCTTCRYDSHIHSYSTIWRNATQHWKGCAGAGCDAITETANHAPADGVCTTCGYDNTPIFPMQMVSIPAGTFQMGSVSGGYDDELPVRQVTLSAFKMGKYQVTQEQYREVMGVNPSYFGYFSSSPAAGEVQGKRPVETVTWFDAIEFCNKLSVKEGLTPVYTITVRISTAGSITSATVTANWENNGYRLPTEAQWEYACRATGTTTDWTFGNDQNQLTNYAWYDANANSMTHQVGKKTENAWGLHDMHGNVGEWCWDWYNSSYYGENDNTNNPMGPVAGSYRVLRGGDWICSAELTRSASRHFYSPDVRFNSFGFRVVRP